MTLAAPAMRCLNDLTDTRVVYSEVVSDRPQRIAPAAIGGDDGLVSPWMLARRLGSWLQAGAWTAGPLGGRGPVATVGARTQRSCPIRGALGFSVVPMVPADPCRRRRIGRTARRHPAPSHREKVPGSIFGFLRRSECFILASQWGAAGGLRFLITSSSKSGPPLNDRLQPKRKEVQDHFRSSG
jgi:hypothetical protein